MSVPSPEANIVNNLLCLFPEIIYAQISLGLLIFCYQKNGLLYAQFCHMHSPTHPTPPRFFNNKHLYDMSGDGREGDLFAFPGFDFPQRELQSLAL